MLSPIYAIRISRIVAVDEPALEAWAKKRLATKKTAPESGASSPSANTEIDRYGEEWLRSLP